MCVLCYICLYLIDNQRSALFSQPRAEEQWSRHFLTLCFNAEILPVPRANDADNSAIATSQPSFDIRAPVPISGGQPAGTTLVPTTTTWVGHLIPARATVADWLWPTARHPLVWTAPMPRRGSNRRPAPPRFGRNDWPIPYVVDPSSGNRTARGRRRRRQQRPRIIGPLLPLTVPRLSTYAPPTNSRVPQEWPAPPPMSLFIPPAGRQRAQPPTFCEGLPPPAHCWPCSHVRPVTTAVVSSARQPPPPRHSGGPHNWPPTPSPRVHAPPVRACHLPDAPPDSSCATSAVQTAPVVPPTSQHTGAPMDVDEAPDSRAPVPPTPPTSYIPPPPPDAAVPPLVRLLTSRPTRMEFREQLLRRLDAR